MEIKDVLLIALPIVSSYLTYLFTSRAKRDEAIFKYKEEKYGNLIILIQGFLHNGDKNTNEMKNKFFEEQYKSWLYSSDEVVLTINHLVYKLKTEKGVINPDVLGEIIVAMRKDMLKNTKLKPSDFQYTIVNNPPSL